jgi:hypothetical protein
MVSFKKTIVNDLSICKIIALWSLQMNLNERGSTDAFMIKFCPVMIQALYLLPLQLSLIIYQTDMTCT